MGREGGKRERARESSNEKLLIELESSREVERGRELDSVPDSEICDTWCSPRLLLDSAQSTSRVPHARRYFLWDLTDQSFSFFACPPRALLAHAARVTRARHSHMARKTRICAP